MILLLIFAFILLVVFTNMTLYVAGGILGILLVIIATIIKRRRTK
jgi:hypothetical protein